MVNDTWFNFLLHFQYSFVFLFSSRFPPSKGVSEGDGSDEDEEEGNVIAV
jgi:hypothetical protein